MCIRYLHEKNLGIELIICKSSSISYPIHNHVSVFTFGVVLDGTINVTIGKTTNQYCANDSFIIPPYVPHEIIAFGSYTLLSCCINKKIFTATPLYALKKITALLFGSVIACNNVSIEQLDLLVGSLDLSHQISTNMNFSEFYLGELINQLELHPERQICIDDMAQSAFISKYYLIRRFKKEIGLTPHQFIVQNRVRKAQHLLSNLGTITEVALTAGFCDQSHFIKNFEKIVGLTPTVYRTSYIPVCFPVENQFNAGMNLANM